MATPTTTPKTPPASKKADPVALVRDHPAGFAIAGGALLGLIVLLRSRNNTAAAASTTPTYTADTTGTDLVNEIQPEIDALARQIGGMGNGLPTSSSALVPPPAGSGQVLIIGGSAPGIYGPGQTAPKDGAAVCQGGTCLTPKDFEALGNYLGSLPGGHA